MAQTKVIIIRILIVVFLLSGTFIALFLYVGQILYGVRGPIKSYSYSMTAKELRGKTIELTDRNPLLKYKLPDGVNFGTPNGTMILLYLIDQNKTFEYSLDFKENNHFWQTGPAADLCIYNAFDLGKWLGGHKLDEADERRLLDTFQLRVANNIIDD